jgi:hypothetical protein
MNIAFAHPAAMRFHIHQEFPVFITPVPIVKPP